MRMSETNCDRFAPAALATAGMISAFGGGLVPFGSCDTGCTRLTERGRVVVVTAAIPTRAESTVDLVTVIVAAVVVPDSSPAVWLMTSTVMPFGGRTPVCGLNVMNGR